MSGEQDRVQVGTYTGGEGGWGCFSSADHNLPAGTWCEFENGIVNLVGVPSGRGDGVWTNVVVARDGLVRAVGNLQKLYRDSQPYRDATRSPPRAGTATVTLTSLTLGVGEFVRIPVGTYTGGEGGWTCFSTSDAPLPPGLWCEFEESVAHLVGRVEAKVSGYYWSFVPARDGHVRDRAPWFRPGGADAAGGGDPIAAAVPGNRSPLRPVFERGLTESFGRRIWEVGLVPEERLFSHVARLRRHRSQR